MQKRRKQQGGAGGGVRRSAAAPTLPWVEAVVDAAGPAAPRDVLTVHLRGGARLELGDVSQVELAAELLRALAKGDGTC